MQRENYQKQFVSLQNCYLCIATEDLISICINAILPDIKAVGNDLRVSSTKHKFFDSQQKALNPPPAKQLYQSFCVSTPAYWVYSPISTSEE